MNTDDDALWLKLDDERECSSLGAVPDYPVDALPDAAAAVVSYGVRSGMPASLVGGAALAALAGSIGAESQLEVTTSWHTRTILWIVQIAPRGAGKSPAQEIAFAPLRSHDGQLDESDERPVRLGEQTLEALARSLKASGDAGVLEVDELVVLLKGMGEYKRSVGGDRGRFLSLWSGAPWSFTRVGGGGKQNAVELRIAKPTLVICGGLQPRLHELLGGEEDGFRPRWLPHLAELPALTRIGTIAAGSPPIAWQQLLGGALLPLRSKERMWKLDDGGLRAFDHYRTAWKRQARGGEAASTSAALEKADVHLARVSLAFAEASRPAAGGPVGSEIVERAAAFIDFTLNCWRALPEQGSFALSRRDQVLDESIERLRDWLEQHGDASRRILQRARVAGVRTGPDLDALLKRYEETFPGTVTTESPTDGRGLPTVVVRAPKRRSITKVSPLVTPRYKQSPNPHEHWAPGAVTTGDTSSGDTSSGDSFEGIDEGAESSASRVRPECVPSLVSVEAEPRCARHTAETAQTWCPDYQACGWVAA
jgi:hypothetical protein